MPFLYRRHSSGEIRNLASVSSSLLPAFGTVVGEGTLQLKRYVIAPYDRRYRWWQTFLVVLVVYSAWSSPFELAFRKVATGSLLPVDLVVDAFFAIDIILTFSVAYLDKSTYLLVDDRKKIAIRWWQTFLVVLVVYSAWSSPFELAFRKVATGSLLPVDLVVDAFFAIDIILTFSVAYLDKSTYLLVDDRKKIAIRNLASVSSSLLPAFGTVVGEGTLQLKRYVIAPYDRRYRWWQTFLVVLVVYSAWSSPFELAFRKVATGSLLPVDLVVDAFFAIDIILTFSVAYLDKSTYLLVDDRKKIAIRYMLLIPTYYYKI
ncbi:unnamed protein product [Ilex paraguariensis]|uniref:Ion transport domain-containing protein n=1 Tax=Ilex paraguariensis TaxID=185542 RepID=A0ABC8TBY0_9AQUA